ncbi:MAG: ABC transporter substrate-binding protein [Planctomycetota bacterium]
MISGLPLPRLVALLGAPLLAAGLCLTPSEASASPDEDVAEAGAAALKSVEAFEIAVQAMLPEGGDLGFRGRYVRLARVVARTHALDAMAEARVGSGWAKLDAAQRKELTNLIFKRLVAGYALRFDGSDELSFERGKPVRGADGRVRIETRVTGRKTGAHTLGFVLASEDGTWRIASVAWDGKDDVASERTGNEKLLARKGWPALVEAWKKRVPLPRSSGEKARTPRQVVERLQEGILAIMKEAKTLGYEGRLRRFAPLVEETHYLPAIAQLTIRRNWKDLTQKQREAFLKRFHDLSIARYAGRFDGYSGETFEIVDERDAGKSKLIRSVLRKTNGKTYTFDYALRNVKGTWRILNITVDGVSDLATKQAEYASIFREGGFQGLMDKVEEQIRKRASDG